MAEDAVLSPDSGILLEIIENDDPNGRGMHMGPEMVMDVPPGGLSTIFYSRMGHRSLPCGLFRFAPGSVQSLRSVRH